MGLIMDKLPTTCYFAVTVLLFHLVNNADPDSSTHCKTLDDWYLGTSPQQIPSPFFITTSEPYYSLSSLITVVLEGRNNETFVSYILYGEDRRKNIAGHFEEMAFENCSHSAGGGLTNNSSSQRFHRIEAHWRGPAATIGKVQFRASVLKDFGRYWNNVTSPIIYYRPASGLCDSRHEFTCSDDHCIPSIWHCDGHNDCGDSSDEVHCHWGVTPDEESTILLKVVLTVGLLLVLMLITYCLRRRITNRLNARSRRPCCACFSRSRRRSSRRRPHSTTDACRDLSRPEINQDSIDDNEESSESLEGAPPKYEEACQFDPPPPCYEEALALEQAAIDSHSASN